MKNNVITFCTVLAGTVILIAAILFGGKAMQKSHQQQIAAQRGETQIVVLGDSIWDLVRDDTGVASYLQQNMGAQTTIYNCAIQGSRAADETPGTGNTAQDDAEQRTDEASETGNTTQDDVEQMAGEQLTGEQEDEASQEEPSVTALTCLTAIAEYIAGVKPQQIPEEYAAAAILPTVDFTQVDYVLIAYGLNDYFGAVKQKNPENCYDHSTYQGALCYAIETIRNAYPNVQFVILSPTYCQGYSYGQVIHESDTYDYGGGTILDYVASGKTIAEAYGYLFVNNYEDLGISIHNGAEYLEDATHLTQEGRQRYADNLAEKLLQR